MVAPQILIPHLLSVRPRSWGWESSSEGNTVFTVQDLPSEWEMSKFTGRSNTARKPLSSFVGIPKSGTHIWGAGGVGKVLGGNDILAETGLTQPGEGWRGHVSG